MSEIQPGDDLTYLGSQEVAVVLHHREADALLAMLEKANNSGIEPGVGLRVEDARAAGFKIVSERFRDQDPYSRGSRIAGVVWRKPALQLARQEHGYRGSGTRTQTVDDDIGDFDGSGH